VALAQPEPPLLRPRRHHTRRSCSSSSKRHKRPLHSRRRSSQLPLHSRSLQRPPHSPRQPPHSPRQPPRSPRPPPRSPRRPPRSHRSLPSGSCRFSVAWAISRRVGGPRRLRRTRRLQPLARNSAARRSGRNSCTRCTQTWASRCRTSTAPPRPSLLSTRPSPPCPITPTDITTVRSRSTRLASTGRCMLRRRSRHRCALPHSSTRCTLRCAASIHSAACSLPPPCLFLRASHLTRPDVRPPPAVGQRLLARA
jgi:hypothetical protein